MFIAITSSWRKFSIFWIIFCDIILSLFPFLVILLCSKEHKNKTKLKLKLKKFLILINDLVLADECNVFFFCWYFLKQVYNTESSFFSHWSYCFWKLIEFDCYVKLFLNIVESFVICLNFLIPSSVNLHCILFLLQLLFFNFHVHIKYKCIMVTVCFLIICYFVRAYGFTFIN